MWARWEGDAVSTLDQQEVWTAGWEERVYSFHHL